ncbi:MAG TPA: hypothetical protein GXX24_14945 [Paracoccus solventivorans]|uniref:Uncharacterized protein n=1 Tax=Paracoccus solventivorans TaxID=53463 RepID=A0A832PQ28_9RHOB|nr:hypothetical protein [Paracoccus solventivorans]HHW35413.1 hypothetical protein [Paracoccus solventivorans]
MCEATTLETRPVAVSSGKYSVIRRGGIALVAIHPVLVDFAIDLALGIPDDFPLKARVTVGPHGTPLPPEDGPHIGIQTEHFLDANGQEMFRTMSKYHKAKFIDGCDHVLELSPANRPAYAMLRASKQRKITYGPYVFPSRPVARTQGGTGLAFAGNVNPRRAEILASLGDSVVRLPRKTWGQDVHTAFLQAAAVLNIHFKDSVVTEAPRLLKAYLAGKPVVSEALAEPIEMGRHAIPLGEAHEAARLDAVFDAFDHEIARKFRFVDFLEKTLA